MLEDERGLDINAVIGGGGSDEMHTDHPPLLTIFLMS